MNHTIASLETHLTKLKMSYHDHFQNLKTQVCDLEESHVNLSNEVSAIAAKVESIKQVMLAFDIQADTAKEKFAKLCNSISRWNHIKHPNTGIALLLSEVSNLNEFKNYNEHEMNCNRRLIAEVESSSTQDLGRFYPEKVFSFWNH